RQVYATVQRAVRAALLEIAEAPALGERAFSAPAWPSSAAPTAGTVLSGLPDAVAPFSEIPATANEPSLGSPPAQPTFAQGPLWGSLPKGWSVSASGAARAPWERGERTKGAAAGFQVPTPGAHEQFQTTGRLPALRVL